MRAVVQRVSNAKVTVDGETVGEIGEGLLVLVAAHRLDTEAEAKKLADRVAGMRIFNDEHGKMNLSLAQAAQGSPGVLVVSNFTLYGDATQRRPSFTEAAPYERGEELYEAFVAELRALGTNVQTGTYGAHMQVALTNDGPVTVIAEHTNK